MTLFLDINGSKVSDVYFCLEEMRKSFDLVNNVIKTNRCNAKAVNELIKNNPQIEPTIIRLIEKANLDKLTLDFGFGDWKGAVTHIWLDFGEDENNENFELIWDLRCLMLDEINKINNIIQDVNEKSSSNVKATVKNKVIEKLKQEQIHPMFIKIVEEIGHAKLYFHFHRTFLSE